MEQFDIKKFAQQSDWNFIDVIDFRKFFGGIAELHGNQFNL